MNIGIKFVTTLAFSQDLRKVALVQKTRPDWLAGKWTAIGGRVEIVDHSSSGAAVRELREESGLEVEYVVPFARCRRKTLGSNGDCLFFAAVVQNIDFAQTKTDERVMVWNVSTLPAYQADLSDDLCALVEMAKMKLRGSRMFFEMSEV